MKTLTIRCYVQDYIYALTFKCEVVAIGGGVSNGWLAAGDIPNLLCLASAPIRVVCVRVCAMHPFLFHVFSCVSLHPTYYFLHSCLLCFCFYAHVRTM